MEEFPSECKFHPVSHSLILRKFIAIKELALPTDWQVGCLKYLSLIFGHFYLLTTDLLASVAGPFDVFTLAASGIFPR